MTREEREEAIKVIQNFPIESTEERKAVLAAIKALEQMPVTTTTEGSAVIYYPQVEGVTPTVIDAGKQEPSGDAIDRKLVCAFIAGLISDDGEREKGLEYIRNMPPVTPQPCEDAISCEATLKPYNGPIESGGRKTKCVRIEAQKREG